MHRITIPAFAKNIEVVINSLPPGTTLSLEEIPGSSPRMWLASSNCVLDFYSLGAVYGILMAW